MQLSLSVAIVALAALASPVVGETHTVTLINNCKEGTPYLIRDEKILSNGTKDYVSDGPLTHTIAYLQPDDKRCGFNGENCAIVQTALINLTPTNVGSLTDISLIPPHVFSVPTGFRYSGGCDGQGANCGGPGCRASREPVGCPVDNVNLTVIFCGA